LVEPVAEVVPYSQIQKVILQYAPQAGLGLGVHSFLKADIAHYARKK
jgi:hypothetical protein